MYKTRNITATELRNNLFQLLNQVFIEDVSLVVIKNGLPVAKIIKASNRKIDLREISVEDALLVLHTPRNEL